MTATLAPVRCDLPDWTDDNIAGDRYCLIHRRHFDHGPQPCPDQPADRENT